MQFSRLRLSGFKSFVDPTELVIEPGLTGIVGPNGCGKSNLVEALHWVMGEHSARKLRGGEMDDVIFGGTSNRPARNLAEVGLYLDNSDRKAPAAFNDHHEIEVTRQIERGSGSTFRINGAEVRARDVQLLFADAATGSRSATLVNQGEAGALITAKPTDRRSLLEEAAGITGLHSRRHEAELRLRAAETNLDRLEDVVAALEAQLHALKRQARQATRYRNLTDHIRRAEATLFYVRWTETSKVLEATGAELEAAEAKVRKLTRRAAIAATAQAEAAARLPGLRESEAAAAAKLQRLLLAREGLDAEEARIHEAREICRQRLVQIAGDIERETARASDAAEALARLDEEGAALTRARTDEEAAERERTQALSVAQSQVADLESRLSDLAERAAADEARRSDLERRVAELEARRTRLAERLDEAAGEKAALEAAASDTGAPEAALAEARAKLEGARAEAEAAERTRIEAQENEAAAREELRSLEAEAAGSRAEERALKELLAVEALDRWPPLLDAVTVEPGHEAALAAALGDDLVAPADEAAPTHWQTLPPYDPPPPLPAGVRPLSDFVRAPATLARRLSQIGVVEDERKGRGLQSRLAQGQRLVSRDGALWRWDGFTVGAGTATAGATRLSQLGRLGELKGELEGAAARAQEARVRFDEARAKAETATQTERELREAVREADAVLQAAREEHAAAAQAQAATASKLAALNETAEGLAADRAEAVAGAAAARDALDSLGDTKASRERVATLRGELAELRATLAERQRAYDLAVREAAARNQRLSDIAEERVSWQARADNAAHQSGELEARKSAAGEELERLASRPEEITAERHRLSDRIEQAETLRKAAADALAEGESALREADRGLKAAEAAVADAREERVRSDAAVTQARQTLEALAERIEERLECKPDRMLEIARLKPEEFPDQSAVEARIERLIRERENMGPVNLRAETELRELDEQIATMQTEREDLSKAIARLRHGINKLNREGRERFLAAYDAVNGHFQDLFTRLFGGGRAHLGLTESDDPLEAGVEIMASPPGKRLQVLSLLSGGEQALTTIALLFAVFMTNPAPICVLDEVDAPLDDANVDRFCALVSEIAQGVEARFLLVTHHRTTMARMDRLFGVTMPERGVSQLVSVDLQGVGHLRAIA
ncbi:MAG: chromosome segregation protein SMC [Alphaproteobacteria bacterium]